MVRIIESIEHAIFIIAIFLVTVIFLQSCELVEYYYQIEWYPSVGTRMETHETIKSLRKKKTIKMIQSDFSFRREMAIRNIDEGNGYSSYPLPYAYSIMHMGKMIESYDYSYGSSLRRIHGYKTKTRYTKELSYWRPVGSFFSENTYYDENDFAYNSVRFGMSPDAVVECADERLEWRQDGRYMFRTFDGYLTGKALINGIVYDINYLFDVYGLYRVIFSTNMITRDGESISAESRLRTSFWKVYGKPYYYDSINSIIELEIKDGHIDNDFIKSYNKKNNILYPLSICCEWHVPNKIIRVGKETQYGEKDNFIIGEKAVAVITYEPWLKRKDAELKREREELQRMPDKGLR